MINVLTDSQFAHFHATTLLLFKIHNRNSTWILAQMTASLREQFVMVADTRAPACQHQSH